VIRGKVIRAEVIRAEVIRAEVIRGRAIRPPTGFRNIPPAERRATFRARTK
jgi:hypothetical protein